MRWKRVGAATGAVLLGGACGLVFAAWSHDGARDTGPAAGCAAGTPAFLSGSQPAVKEATSGDDGVAIALRDETSTVIGYCRTSSGVQAEPPRLRDGDRVLTAVGGKVTGKTGDYANYVLYPPTHGDVVEVLEGSEVVARLAFPETQEKPYECPTTDARRVSVEACGAVLVLRWETGLDVDPRTIELVDVTTRDDVMPGRGFYLHRLHRDDTGLVVSFGMEAPESRRIHLQLRETFVRRPDGDIVGVPYDPPLREVVDLEGGDEWLASVSGQRT